MFKAQTESQTSLMSEETQSRMPVGMQDLDFALIAAESQPEDKAVAEIKELGMALLALVFISTVGSEKTCNSKSIS